MSRIVILMNFLLSISNVSFSQNQKVGYRGGNDSLNYRITKYLMKSHNPDIWADSNFDLPPKNWSDVN
jgi:hypothetical protein